ncbi:MAG: three-helix bundle dimerization domain-containing protein [Rhodococcus sp. (in: high G+C Gram-positive bacteria)]
MTITESVPTTRLLTDELTSISTMLAARFPHLTHADVDDAVRTTYARLDSTARVRAHLIPLTSNRARVVLDRMQAERAFEDELRAVSTEVRRALPPIDARSS